jgi:N-acetylmuramic acid 6-phosphate etherase
VTNKAAALPATEQVSPRYRDLDLWDIETSLDAMWEGQLAAVAAVRPGLPAIAAAVRAAQARLEAGGRLIYCGAGTSGRIGVQDGAELPPTFDWPTDRLVLLIAGGSEAFTRSIENAEDDRDAARAAMAAHAVDESDVVIGIAASGGTPYTVACLSAARARGALTIAIANSAGALLGEADHPILVETGSEVIAGSTRMKAGTAQKIVLNLLSSALMVAMGRVYQGLMVDMQARNEKLRHRSLRMLRHLTGRDEAAARAALEAAGGRVKTAVLVLEGMDAAAADGLLAECAGRLRTALRKVRA